MIASIAIFILLIMLRLSKKVNRFLLMGLVLQVYIISIYEQNNELATSLFVCAIVLMSFLKKRLLLGNQEGNREY